MDGRERRRRVRLENTIRAHPPDATTPQTRQPSQTTLDRRISPKTPVYIKKIKYIDISRSLPLMQHLACVS